MAHRTPTPIQLPSRHEPQRAMLPATKHDTCLFRPILSTHGSRIEVEIEFDQRSSRAYPKTETFQMSEPVNMALDL